MGRVGGDGDGRGMNPNHSLIQFVCCSSEGVSYVTIIMKNCVVGCF